MSNRSNDPDDFDNFDNDLDDLDNDLGNFDQGFGDDDDDLPPLDDNFDEGPESRGPSRTFIIIAAVMILLFVVALGALIFFVTNQGPSPVAQTATVQSAMIFTQNAQTLADATQTAEAALIFGGTLTQEAINQQLTANAPTATETSTLPPTVTPTPTLDPTDMAGTQIALNAAATLTAAAQVPTATPTSEGVSDISAVAQTATALAGILVPTIESGQGGGEIASPTVEGGFAPLPTALPDTGLFDDLAAGGSNSIGIIALAIVGLGAMIFVSRRLRSSINK